MRRVAFCFLVLNILFCLLAIVEIFRRGDWMPPLSIALMQWLMADRIYERYPPTNRESQNAWPTWRIKP